MDVQDDPGGYWLAGEPARGPGALPEVDLELRPAGHMAPFVGPALSPAALEEALQHAWDGEAFSADVEAVRRRGRVFPVPPLTGLAVSAPRLGELGAALSAALAATIGGIWPTSLELGTIEKYRFLHVCLPAPRDEAADQPMALEVVGDVVVGSWPAEIFDEPRPVFGAPENLQAGPVSLTITNAHWCNYQHAGSGAGVYM